MMMLMLMLVACCLLLVAVSVVCLPDRIDVGQKCPFITCVSYSRKVNANGVALRHSVFVEMDEIWVSAVSSSIMLNAPMSNVNNTQ
jgi:hypothetical protein